MTRSRSFKGEVDDGLLVGGGGLGDHKFPDAASGGPKADGKDRSLSTILDGCRNEDLLEKLLLHLLLPNLFCVVRSSMNVTNVFAMLIVVKFFVHAEKMR